MNIRSFLIPLLSLVCTLGVTAQQLPKSMQKLMNAEYAISQFYVDSVDDNKLVVDAITGMLEKLDPHSTYTDPKETKDLEEPLSGEFSGIGIQFNMSKDTLYVIQTTAGGPSERVGIIAGDRIMYVNDTLIAGVKMKNTDIVKRLRGKKGTKVVVKVKRGQSDQLLTFTITREKIELHSVDAAYMLDDKKTGYIRISSFGVKTYKEMMDALEQLKKQGMTQLVMDLSDNGGGYLNAAIEMVNEFLDRGQMIVYTEGKNSPRNEAKATGGGKYKDLKLAVIINQFSASAAEIFTGAMQDWDRGVVIGRRSFAKGLVQRPFRFDDGSMMRLTIARYYTPSGRCIQKPYTKGDKKHYDMDVIDRSKDGEYFHLDSVRFNDTLRYTTLRTHRPVYGGGGIIPDVFVALDTTEYSTFYRDLMTKGVINQYTIDYVDAHRQEVLKKHPTIEDYDRHFQITDKITKDLLARAEKEKVKYDEKQYQTSKQLICDVLKGLIGRDIYTDPSAYTRVINHRNRELAVALEVLNDDTRYQQLLTQGNPEIERIAEKRKAERVAKPATAKTATEEDSDSEE